jgi:[acyl-carrier-protein] S-malonyltransferase
MAKKYVFLFPGQGAQEPGMMKDLCGISGAARNCLTAISDAAGEDMAQLLWNTDAVTLSRTDRSQLAITAASLMALSALKEQGIIPAACAGFSLGEFPAFRAAGVLSFEDTVKVVKQRGIIMQAVCEAIAAGSAGGRAPGMAAVLGLPPEKVEEIAAACDGVYAANLNSVKQTVVSGTADGLDKAEGLFKGAGARRMLRLAVAGPFHSPLMREAADKFAQAIANVRFNDPAIPLFSNVTGKRVTSGTELKKNAVLHLTLPVRWTDEEEAIGALIDSDTASQWTVLEVGPGRVLSGLWKDTPWSEKYPSQPVNDAALLAAL